MYIAGSEDIVEASSKESGKGSSFFKGSARDARRTYKAVHGRFRQFYRQFYRYRLSFTGTRMEFTGCFIGLYGHRVQLFLVLATYCVVLGPIPSAEHLIERTLTHLSP